ncbi:YihY/virulence factor BrkB family protein [Tautonia plasticadhaerens]|uniref:Uncharacterized protein n=1 Tax=Tautonia plasticadhaerens TaxID=2527974 RepID=A0A518HER5_9BACT|nr:YihY/virulence factor BrkB family protein [Tautonia plasticadhaerens]QDV39347.1 hypothetical protein ElP_73130 [Tautonia plasticadhaerens]
MRMKTFWGLLRQTAREWHADKAHRLGAAVAFYCILTLVPLLAGAVALAGPVLGDRAARWRVVEQMRRIVGVRGGEAVETLVISTDTPETGAVALVGVSTLLFAATALFGQLKDALNTMWGVHPVPGRGLRGLLRERFLSLSLVLGVASLLLVSLTLGLGLAALGDSLVDLLPGYATAVRAGHFAFSLGVVATTFALVFKYLPDAHIAWRDVWVGAGITAVLHAVGVAAVRLYLDRSPVGVAYGAASSFVVLLLWVYYSSQILLFGAEFTQVYANAHGDRICPAADAECVTEQARARQGMPRGKRPGRRGPKEDGHAGGTREAGSIAVRPSSRRRTR